MKYGVIRSYKSLSIEFRNQNPTKISETSKKQFLEFYDPQFYKSEQKTNQNNQRRQFWLS